MAYAGASGDGPVLATSQGGDGETAMSNRGKRMYVCRDCGEKRLVHWVELNRAAIPRCRACGGALDEFSEGAKEDRLIGDMNIRERGQHPGVVAKPDQWKHRHERD